MNQRFVLIGAAIFAACSEPAGPRPAMPDAAGRIAFVIDDRVHDGAVSVPRDGFTLLEAGVEGDTLVMSIQFGGGCFDHEFVLVGSRRFAESLPVQTPVLLSHDANDDGCRALLTQTLRADISALRESYEQSYGPGPATIAINVAGRQVHYSF